MNRCQCVCNPSSDSYGCCSLYPVDDAVSFHSPFHCIHFLDTLCANVTARNCTRVRPDIPMTLAFFLSGLRLCLCLHCSWKQFFPLNCNHDNALDIVTCFYFCCRCRCCCCWANSSITAWQCVWCLLIKRLIRNQIKNAP